MTCLAGVATAAPASKVEAVETGLSDDPRLFLVQVGGKGDPANPESRWCYLELSLANGLLKASAMRPGSAIHVVQARLALSGQAELLIRRHLSDDDEEDQEQGAAATALGWEAVSEGAHEELWTLRVVRDFERPGAWRGTAKVKTYAAGLCREQVKTCTIFPEGLDSAGYLERTRDRYPPRDYQQRRTLEWYSRNGYKPATQSDYQLTMLTRQEREALSAAAIDLEAVEVPPAPSTGSVTEQPSGLPFNPLVVVVSVAGVALLGGLTLLGSARSTPQIPTAAPEPVHSVQRTQRTQLDLYDDPAIDSFLVGISNLRSASSLEQEVHVEGTRVRHVSFASARFRRVSGSEEPEEHVEKTHRLEDVLSGKTSVEDTVSLSAVLAQIEEGGEFTIERTIESAALFSSVESTQNTALLFNAGGGTGGGSSGDGPPGSDSGYVERTMDAQALFSAPGGGDESQAERTMDTQSLFSAPGGGDEPEVERTADTASLFSQGLWSDDSQAERTMDTQSLFSAPGGGGESQAERTMDTQSLFSAPGGGDEPEVERTADTASLFSQGLWSDDSQAERTMDAQALFSAPVGGDEPEAERTMDTQSLFSAPGGGDEPEVERTADTASLFSQGLWSDDSQAERTMDAQALFSAPVGGDEPEAERTMDTQSLFSAPGGGDEPEVERTADTASLFSQGLWSDDSQAERTMDTQALFSAPVGGDEPEVERTADTSVLFPQGLWSDDSQGERTLDTQSLFAGGSAHRAESGDGSVVTPLGATEADGTAVERTMDTESLFNAGLAGGATEADGTAVERTMDAESLFNAGPAGGATEADGTAVERTMDAGELFDGPA